MEYQFDKVNTSLGQFMDASVAPVRSSVKVVAMSEDALHFGAWLREMLKIKGQSIRGFAAQLPVSAATVQTWLSSEAPDIQGHNIGRLAKAIDWSVEDLEILLTGAREKKPRQEITTERLNRIIRGKSRMSGIPVTDDLNLVRLRRVPYFDLRMSASGWSDGFDGRTVDDADGFVEVPEDAPSDAFAFRIQGDCMEPKFPDGAIVICVPVRPGDHGEQFVAGKAYYFQRVGECATFKLCFYEPPMRRYRLEPINKKYKPIYVPEQDMQRMSRAIKIVIDLT